MFHWLNFVLPVYASPLFASIRFTLRRPHFASEAFAKNLAFCPGTHIPPTPKYPVKKIHPYADIVNKNIITFIEETQHVASNYSVVECPMSNSCYMYTLVYLKHGGCFSLSAYLTVPKKVSLLKKHFC